MKKRFILIMISVVSAAVLFGQNSNYAAEKKRNVDNFVIILDSSASFGEEYNGKSKLEHAKDIAAGAAEGGMTEDQIHVGASHEELSKVIQENVQNNDTILVKGSRAMKMETVAAYLAEKFGKETG